MDLESNVLDAVCPGCGITLDDGDDEYDTDGLCLECADEE